MLLHVVDCAAAERDGNIAEVESVLAEIDASDVPQLRVYNKIDLLERGEARIDRDEHGQPEAIWLSAVDRNGFELLTRAIGELLGKELLDEDILLTPADAKLRAILYGLGAIQREQHEDNGDMLLSVRLQVEDFKRALARAEIAESRFLPEVREAWQ